MFNFFRTKVQTYYNKLWGIMYAPLRQRVAGHVIVHILPEQVAVDFKYLVGRFVFDQFVGGNIHDVTDVRVIFPGGLYFFNMQV